jgi:hypothetical protein
MLQHQADTLKYEKSRCRWFYIYGHVPSYDAVYRHMTPYDVIYWSYDSIPILIQVVRIADVGWRPGPGPGSGSAPSGLVGEVEVV